MKTLLMSALLLPALASAGPPSNTGSPELAAPGKPTLQLEATARSQVANDEMVAVLTADRTGQNVATLNDTVMAALNDAVKEAKSTPQVNVRLGSFSTIQNWENGKQSGWRVHGEVVLNSSDMKALSLLVGKLGQTLLVSGVSFRLSNKAREAEEKVLLAKAAGNFEAKAGATAAAFGFAGYQVKDLSLSQSGSLQPPRPMPMMLAMKSSAAAAMPAEGGDSDVSVTVSGSVTLMK